MGRIYDDRGHRMTPSHVRKRGIKYRYYISSALLAGPSGTSRNCQPDPSRRDRGSRRKIVFEVTSTNPTDIENAALIHNHVVRVEVQSDQLVIELANAKGAGPKRKRSRKVIEVPWRKTPSTRRREVLVPEAGPPQDARPIRSENRAILVASIARGRRWLDELIADPTANTESIAGREGCSVRKVNMTISLAFLAPDLVKAAIDGRLPHGMGVARLCDLPAEWSRQRQMLGLAAL